MNYTASQKLFIFLIFILLLALAFSRGMHYERNSAKMEKIIVTSETSEFTPIPTHYIRKAIHDKDKIIENPDSVFITNGDVYLQNSADERKRKKKLTDGGNVLEAKLSPDKKNVVFLKTEKQYKYGVDNSAHIYIVSIKDLASKKLTTQKFSSYHPMLAWSYDSKYVSFYDYYQIQIVDIATYEITTVFKRTWIPSEKTDQVSPPFGNPEWAKDTNRLLFTSRITNQVIYPIVWNAETKKITKYDNIKIQALAFWSSLFWVDSNTIIFQDTITASGSRPVGEIAKANLQTGAITKLTQIENLQYFSLSPNKQFIALSQYFGTGGPCSTSTISVQSLTTLQTVYTYETPDCANTYIAGWASNSESFFIENTFPEEIRSTNPWLDKNHVTQIFLNKVSNVEVRQSGIDKINIAP